MTGPQRITEPLGPQKAIAAFVLSTIGGIITACLVAFPDDDTVQTWGGLLAGIITVIATTYAVYQTTNQPVQDEGAGAGALT